jgi:hypothetical protein
VSINKSPRALLACAILGFGLLALPGCGDKATKPCPCDCPQCSGYWYDYHDAMDCIDRCHDRCHEDCYH